MVPHALDASGRRAVTSEDGGNHSKLKEPVIRHDSLASSVSITG